MKKSTLIQRIFRVVGISALTILFFACSADSDDEVQKEIQIEKQSDKAEVFFSVTESSERTVLPQVSLEDVASYKLLGGKDSEAETELVDFFTGTGTTVSLEPGTWNFTLNAYNSSGGHILQGKVQNKEISLTGTNQVSFSLSALKSGTGSIRITLNFPESAGITEISANGDINSENFTYINYSNFVYTKNGVNAGDYFINFELYRGDALLVAVSELVIVRSSLTSSKTITLIGEDLKPVLTGTVSISGSAVIGETLTADISDLNGTGAVSYQWKRGNDNIGTNASTYTVQEDDAGGAITVTVTRDGYIGDVTSSLTAAVSAPVFVTLNSVTANGSSTQTTTQLTLSFSQAITNLSADDITITHSVSSQSVIKGTLTASGSTYTLPISGFTNSGTLSVAVAKPGYTISGSPKTGISIYNYIPPLTGTVGINGTLQTGQTLTAVTTNLNGNGTITYQWMRGTTVVGSNSGTYTVQSADVSSTNFVLRVTRAGYSGYIDSLPMLAGTVSITGTAQTGQTLTANTASLGGSGTFTYQWKRGTTNIGTNSSTYTVQSADANSTISVTVTRTGYSGYATSSVTVVTTVNITAIQGVTVPVAGGIPVAAIAENTQYSGTITWSPTVTGSTAKTVKIDMYDSYGDGWNGSGALRINVNGTNIASNVKVQSGYNNTYTFNVSAGDVVQVYWVAGSYQEENSFIMYYSDTPPSPAFTTSNQGPTSWSGSNALVYRLRNTMNGISGGTLLGSFTNSGSFAATTQYTATITLTAKSGYTLQGVSANFFTVVGATTVSNSANSGVVTAVFPATPIIEMVYVPGGSFQMGNPDTSAGNNDERPVHTVTLSGFYMGKYQVTQAQYQAVMGSNPSYFNSNPASGEVQGKRPVDMVSWYDAIVFCNKLSIAEGLSPAYRISGSTNPSDWGTVPTSSNSTWNAVAIVAGSNGYRLPTEAQWEYAAKGGNGSPGNYTYSGSNTVGDVAWYTSNSNSMTHEVGKKQPNGLGIYDMSGNVWERCWDWYGSYTSGAQTDPIGPSSGDYRVERGGAWAYDASRVHSTCRGGTDRPGDRHNNDSLRLVRP